MRLALADDFADTGTAYAYYTYDRGAGLTNRIAEFPFSGIAWIERRVLLDGIPGHELYNGGRLVLGPDGHLYATTGWRHDNAAPQDLGSLAGKIVRLTTDGRSGRQSLRRFVRVFLRPPQPARPRLGRSRPAVVVRIAGRWMGVGKSVVAKSYQAGLPAAHDAVQGAEPQPLLVFAGLNHDPQQLADGVAAAAPGVPVLGCSTHGEIDADGPQDGSVVVTALGGEGFSWWRSSSPPRMWSSSARRTPAFCTTARLPPRRPS